MSIFNKNMSIFYKDTRGTCLVVKNITYKMCKSGKSDILHLNHLYARKDNLTLQIANASCENRDLLISLS